MSAIVIEDKWLKIAQMFGQVEQVVHLALQSYFIEQCQQRFNQATIKITEYRKKYQCDYETFKQAVQTDDNFIKSVEAQNPFWEEDAMEWEYWLEEQKKWHNQLKVISPH
jgi:hypothetical protein